MGSMTLVAAELVAIAALLYLFALAIYRLYFHPLSGYPGPRLAAISRWYSAFYAWRGILHLRNKTWHDKYGSVFRSGPNELSFNSSSSLQVIYRNSSVISKPGIWEALSASRRTPNILSAVDDAVHNFKRRTISKMFSGYSLKQIEGRISGRLNHFVDLLVKPGPKHDLQDLCDWLSFDIISDLLYSESCDMLQRPEFRWIPCAYKIMSQRSMVCLVQPKFFQYYIDRLFLLRDYRNIMAAGTWARERTKERLKRKDHEKDFFSLFIEGKSNDGSLQYSEKDMWVESILLLAAGADTTSTTLCALFFHLLHNQEVLLKVIGEIRTSFTKEDDITGSQLNHCVYLDACVKETMRLVPAVPNLSPRLVNSGGLTIRGRYIPPGTIVGTSLYTLMRNSNYFDRADEFLPERWLSRGCRSQLLKLEGFEPFGTGLRSCVGMKLAELELKMTIARTLFKCDLRLCPETARYDAPAGFSFKGWAVASGEKNQIGDSYVANIAEVRG